MPTSLTEKHDSRKITTGEDGDAQSAEFVYTLTGVADVLVATANNSAQTLEDLGEPARTPARCPAAACRHPGCGASATCGRRRRFSVR
ncbi:MAG: hypothetical protein KGY99_09085 [Phycisphaerae bacterium]|nr:hypothetical protein [Phycisphaerae bacterium]